MPFHWFYNSIKHTHASSLSIEENSIISFIWPATECDSVFIHIICLHNKNSKKIKMKKHIKKKQQNEPKRSYDTQYKLKVILISYQLILFLLQFL